MTMNQPNPQRGTGVRKAATGVRPAVPAPAPAPAPQAAGRPGAPRRPGAPAPAGARPPLRSGAAQPEGSGKLGKWMLIVIIVLLGGMVGYGFVPRKAADGTSKPGLFMALVKKYFPGASD